MARRPDRLVNLDALIPRGDLFESPDAAQADSMEIRITDLEPTLTYNLLRKPDFQRETTNWKPEQVLDLIETFCASDIIPAIILWQHGNQVFVVDGAHRLSALIGWVREDFGAGPLSQKLYGTNISEHQRAMHDLTMTLVTQSVGRWEDYKAQNSVLSMKALQTQWIQGRTAPQAAKAFIRINQGGTIIDPLEVRILNAARSALSVATRVIVRGGTGHQYWKHFSDKVAQEKTPKLGAEIHKLLYSPPLEFPIKTTDVPLAGIGSGPSALRLAFDLVGLSNSLPVPDSTRAKPKENLQPDDTDGTATVNYLKRTSKLVKLVLSNHSSSFGLHPALWFYSANGNFQPAALLNVVGWLIDLERRQKLDAFRLVRGQFEDLFLAHPVIIKPESHRFGSGARTRAKMMALLDRILELLCAGKSPEQVWATLKKENDNLQRDEDEQLAALADGKEGGSFSLSVKNAATFADLHSVPRCYLCNGLLHRNGKTLDHVKKKAEGGKAAANNARWVHPVCNSNRDKDEAMTKP